MCIVLKFWGHTNYHNSLSCTLFGPNCSPWPIAVSVCLFLVTLPNSLAKCQCQIVLTVELKHFFLLSPRSSKFNGMLSCEYLNKFALQKKNAFRQWLLSTVLPEPMFLYFFLSSHCHELLFKVDSLLHFFVVNYSEAVFLPMEEQIKGSNRMYLVGIRYLLIKIARKWSLIIIWKLLP